MRLVIAAGAGAGLWLAAAGLPVLRTRTLAERVEPYLGGLHGKPSALVRLGAPARSRLVERVATVLGGREEPAGLRARLAAAGSTRSPDDFRVEQVTWALGGLAAALGLTIAAVAAGLDVAPAAVPAGALVAAVTGWAGRDWWLTRQIASRHEALRAELPPAIDLLVLSLMAGESVPAAFARVAALLRGPLAEEVETVLADIRTGSTAIEALEAFGTRVADPAVGRLVDALCTGIEKGAPLADVLRAQADDGRDLARRRLLELGGRREVWMLVPVVFLIMPVVVVWALFPGLVSLELLVP
ncbi:MAG TPA: type II secretion system F family protein [Actinomycetota bacterium]|nr:type II secretion system F family protein [Actinomycetota bacterium]